MTGLARLRVCWIRKVWCCKHSAGDMAAMWIAFDWSWLGDWIASLLPSGLICCSCFPLLSSVWSDGNFVFFLDQQSLWLPLKKKCWFAGIQIMQQHQVIDELCCCSWCCSAGSSSFLILWICLNRIHKIRSCNREQTSYGSLHDHLLLSLHNYATTVKSSRCICW